MSRFVFRMVALAAAILTAGVSLADEDVLYWMVDDTAEVAMKDGTTQTISSFVSPTSDYAARIRVTGGTITQDTFLQLYGPDGLESGELGVDFDDGSQSGYWGAGVPTGNQSPSGDYSSGTPEYSFIVEIGNVVWDDSTGDWSWTTVATASAAVTYSNLGDFIHQSFDLKPPASQVWTPTKFVEVPEPSCGLLTAIGLSLLALRRKRFDGRV